MALTQIAVRNQAAQTVLVNALVLEGWKPDPTTPIGTETVILMPATTPPSKQVQNTMFMVDPKQPKGVPLLRLAVKNLKL